MGRMAAFILRRALASIVVLFIVVTGVFFFMRLAGDPVAGLLSDNSTAEQVIKIRAEFGLDRPLVVQYADYMRGVVSGDFGRSFRFGGSAFELVIERLPATPELVALSLVIAITIALPIGILSAIRPGSKIDNISRVFAVIGQSMPVFWLGLLLIILFAVKLKLLPSGGYGTWQQLVLPAFTLSVYAIPLTMRLVRSSLLDVLVEPYITAARAKGIVESKVIVVHALRNALIPVLTVLAIRIGHIVSGTVVLEQVFAYPGIGRLAIDAMLFLDFNVVLAFVAVVASMILFLNFVVDILYGVLDPRMRVA